MDGSRSQLTVTSQLVLNAPSIIAGSFPDQGAERFRKSALTLKADLVSDCSDRQPAPHYGVGSFERRVRVVDAAKDGDSLTAGLVAAGAGGLKPPF